MDTSSVIQIFCLLLLLACSAFFSSAETALTTVNRIRIRSLADEGDHRAEDVLKITDNMSKMLSAILIGNNIANLSASALATSVTIRLFGSYAVGVATGILTFLVLIFGEITPKTIATIRAEKISLSYSHVILGIMLILTPLIFIVNKCSSLILLIMRIDPSDKASVITEEELRAAVDVSHEEGVIEKDEHTMFHNVISFGDARARDVMVPRVRAVFADINSSYEELIELFRQNKFTRLPVYEDTTDNIIGIINFKDLLLRDERGHFSVRDILREAYFTYENKSTSELLLEMRKESCNMAIVLDEYGVPAGLLTLEDLLEEIVGEIHDEYDEDETSPITQVGEREYLAEGTMNLEDFCEALDLNLKSEDYDSLGGYIIERLDRVAVEGDEVVTEDHVRLIVDSMDDKRVDIVRVYLPEPPASGEEEPLSV